MTNKKIASEIAIGIILLIAVVMGGLFWMQNKSISKIQNATDNKIEIRNTSEKGGVGMANPASVFCEKNGGKLEIVTNPDGGQSGNCIFVDGSKCEEWAYMRGECKAGKNNKEVVMCTQDAKLCEDGSYVSRTGVNCEFTECPSPIKVMYNEQNVASKFSYELIRNNNPDISNNDIFDTLKVYNGSTLIFTTKLKYTAGDVNLLKESKNYAFFEVSHDGRGGYYLYGLYDSLFRVNLANNHVDIVKSSSDDGVSYNSFNAGVTADDNMVAINDFENITVKNLASGKSVSYRLPNETQDGQFGDLNFSPDMKKIAFGVGYGPDQEHGEIYILDLETKKYSLYKKISGVNFEIIGWKNNTEIDWKMVNYDSE